MKRFIVYIICTFWIGTLLNGRSWTNREGQTMEADYYGTEETGGEIVVVFRKSDGLGYRFPLKELSAEDQLYISSGKAAEEASAKGNQAASVSPPAPTERAKTAFENEITQNLVRSERRGLSAVGSDEIGAKDYYAIYYSASWCPPCRAFTPDLVSFYKRQQKRNGDKFEIIFVSSDRDENAMVGYMRDYSMPWPALDYKKIRASRTLTQYRGRGIPCLVLVDKNGEVISDSYEGDKYVGPTKVLRDLAAKLRD